jgi:hypothetical protein
MEISPPQCPSFAFIPLIPKQALTECFGPLPSVLGTQQTDSFLQCMDIAETLFLGAMLSFWSAARSARSGQRRRYHVVDPQHHSLSTSFLLGLVSTISSPFSYLFQLPVSSRDSEQQHSQRRQR